MSKCKLTEYSGRLPNDGQTDEENMHDCTDFMRWVVNDFTKELNEEFPGICAASIIGDMTLYKGEWQDGMTLDTGESASIGNLAYISKIDNNSSTPSQNNDDYMCLDVFNTVHNNDGFNRVNAITSLTQVEYDGIVDKSTDTLYLITD